MSHTFHSELVGAALAGSIPYDLLQRVASACATTAPALLEELAVHVARKYAAGEMPFDKAAFSMNAAFAVATSEDFWAAHDRTIPPGVFEVYQAFDEGEYFHNGDGEHVDPTLKYTKPLIQRFLSARESNA